MTKQSWAAKALLDLLKDPSEPFSSHARLTIEGIALALQTEHENGQKALASLVERVKEVEEAVCWPGTGAATTEEATTTETKAPEPEPVTVAPLVEEPTKKTGVDLDLFPNAGQKYSCEELLKLIRFAAEQKALNEVAAELGRTKSAVTTKLVQLGFINVNFMDNERSRYRYAASERVLNWAPLVFAIGVSRNFERAGFDPALAFEELAACGFVKEKSYFKAPRALSYIQE